MADLHVLVPLDGSSFSRTVLGAIRSLFDSSGVRLTLLRVGEMPPPAGGTPPSRRLGPGGVALHDFEAHGDTERQVWQSQEWESARQRLRDDVMPDARRLERDGWTVDIATGFGDPANEIESWCRDHEPDLVAMATHGRSGLSRALLGSVAERTLRRLSVPVLMLRPEEVVAAADEPVAEAAAEFG